MKALAPNSLLQNRYLVVQLIGKGGMGEVYLAVDQRLGSAVALKRTFFSDDEMLGSAFEREAKTLARLRHPVLPKVSDHFTENETQYLAMEHISGDDLSKRLEISDKPFPLSWVLFWTDQLLDALAYLHTHEPPIVHRDIKPQNLKLTDDNHIVLLDFGLAKNSIGNTRLTSTGGSVVGYTPHYAPMEQIRGTGTNPRSDLYSLSATVYQLLTNIVPPDAITRADSVLNGLPDPTKPLNTINPEIPKVISDVILKGMSLSMDQRYADAREMQKALREAYNGIQSSMSAQTVTFDKSDVEIPPASAGQQKVEDFPPISRSSEQIHNYQPQKKSFSSSADNNESHNDFEMTMKDNKQDFGIKTEVLPREKMPHTENYAVPSSPENYSVPLMPESESQANDDFSFAPEDDFSSEREKQFDPGVTVPLINFDKEDISPTTAERFDSNGNSEKTFIPSQPSTSARNLAAVKTSAPQAENFAPAAPVRSAPPKKSSGKALAVAGSVIAFLVLAVGAVGIGWYLMKPSETTTVTATPTPVVESTPTPAVSPTAEPTIEANTNTGVSNSSDANTSGANTSDVTPVSSDTLDTAVKKTDTSTGGTRSQNDRTAHTTTPKTTPARTGSTINTPRPPTPQKTPVKRDRTIILQ